MQVKAEFWAGGRQVTAETTGHGWRLTVTAEAEKHAPEQRVELELKPEELARLAERLEQLARLET